MQLMNINVARNPFSLLQDRRTVFIILNYSRTLIRCQPACRNAYIICPDFLHSSTQPEVQK